MANMTANLINERSMLHEAFDIKPMILWEDLTLYDKVKLFSMWSLISIIGSIL